MKGKNKKAKTINIPELDLLAKEFKPVNSRWSEEEKEIVRQYGKKISHKDLADYINKTYNTNRTPLAVEHMVKRLGEKE